MDINENFLSIFPKNQLMINATKLQFGWERQSLDLSSSKQMNISWVS